MGIQYVSKKTIELQCILLNYPYQSFSRNSYSCINPKTGPELKYTGVVAWEVIRRAFCCAHDNSPFAYKYDSDQPYKPYSNIESFLFAMTSGLYAILGSDIMAIYKKIIVVFNSECADEVEAYDQIRANLLDDSSRILPLLYDENAEYSIRDVDMLNGIG